mgnify:CR=1 FL=1
MSVFVDTAALYALLVETEEEHDAVAAEFRRLVDLGRRLVTSNYVLVETAAVLQARFGLAPVRDLDAHFVPLLDVQWVSKQLHRLAMDRLVKADLRELSLVDCSSFELMDAGGIKDAFTLDEDFATQGYRVLPRL